MGFFWGSESESELDSGCFLVGKSFLGGCAVICRRAGFLARFGWIFGLGSSELESEDSDDLRESLFYTFLTVVSATFFWVFGCFGYLTFYCFLIA